MHYQHVNHKECFHLSRKVYLLNGASSMLFLCGITRHACLIQVQLDVHYILYFLDNVSSACFGCYLHPLSGAQLQRTAIGFVWFGVLFHWSMYWFGTALHLSMVSSN
jgi:hypothetical protein